jgi:hypothetical protein
MARRSNPGCSRDVQIASPLPSGEGKGEGAPDGFERRAYCLLAPIKGVSACLEQPAPSAERGEAEGVRGIPVRTAIIFVVLHATIIISSLARADGKPEVKSVLPFGVRAGRTTTVTIYGDNLSPASVTTALSGAKASLVSAKPTDDKTKSKGNSVVSVSLSVPSDAPPENIELQLIQPDKSKLAATVSVVEDADEEAQVKKPASTYAQAMPVTAKSIAISGTLDGDTADVFKLEAAEGDTWSISLLAGRGGSQLDPVLRVRDARHITLMLSAGDKKKDRKLLFKAPAPGTYYIDITDAEARGGFEYRLTVRAGR